MVQGGRVAVDSGYNMVQLVYLVREEGLPIPRCDDWFLLLCCSFEIAKLEEQKIVQRLHHFNCNKEPLRPI
jgi:hypothetical protein